MSDAREAFEKWYMSRGWVDTFDPLIKHDHGAYIVAETCEAWEAWQAALQHSGEPVAWMSPNKQSLEFSRPDTVYGSHTIPLYTTPQPVVPERLESWVELLDEALEHTHSGDIRPVRSCIVAVRHAMKTLLSAGKGGE
jgi:hypothetical protein